MECWNATSGAVRGWINEEEAARAA